MRLRKVMLDENDRKRAKMKLMASE